LREEVPAKVVVEATYGWYRIVDLLQANGHFVHLADPRGSTGGGGG
jgi:transposase